MKMRKITAVLVCLALACAACAAAAEAVPFATVGDAMNGREFTYWFTGCYVILAEHNGTWWRVDAQLDEHARKLEEKVNSADDNGEAYDEMTAYLRTLPAASAEKLSEQPISNQKLDSYTGKKMKDLLADGFSFDWAQAFTADQEQADGRARILRPADNEGKTWRIPLYLLWSESADGLVFSMNRGIYAYQVCFDGTAEKLQEAAGDGSWEEMEITFVSFGGFSSDTQRSMMEDSHTRRVLTAEAAAKIRTAEDLQDYDYVSNFSEDASRFFSVVNGEDCFWIATADIDADHQDLVNLGYPPDDASSEALWQYVRTLPVTVTRADCEHPDRLDPAAFAGKTVGELQAAGLEVSWFYATTTDPSKESWSMSLRLPDAQGQAVIISGAFSWDDWNEYCMLDMQADVYLYTAYIDGTAETLEEAAAGGTFQSLVIRELTYSGLSPSALETAGLR